MLPAEKSVAELGDKVTDADKKPINDAIERVRTAAKGEDAAAIKAAKEALQQAMMAMGQAFYSKQGGAAGGPGGAGPDMSGGPAGGAGKPDDDTIDVEYKEKT